LSESSLILWGRRGTKAGAYRLGYRSYQGYRLPALAGSALDLPGERLLSRNPNEVLRRVRFVLAVGVPNPDHQQAVLGIRQGTHVLGQLFLAALGEPKVRLVV
jgi:hypothetical protein